MTQEPTRFYMRRIGFMALTGSVLINLAVLAAMFAVFGNLAPASAAQIAEITITE